MGRGNIVRVGERVAVLVRPDGHPAVLVGADEYEEPRHARLRAYAHQHGLPLDCGLVKRDLTVREDTPDTDRLRLHTSEAVIVELSVDASNGNSALALDVITDTPEAPD